MRTGSAGGFGFGFGFAFGTFSMSCTSPAGGFGRFLLPVVYLAALVPEALPLAPLAVAPPLQPEAVLAVASPPAAYPPELRLFRNVFNLHGYF